MTRKRQECLPRPLCSCQNVFHRKLAGRFQILQFLPIEWQANRRAQACPNRIVGNRRRSVIVPEIIDEYPACAFGFAHCRHIRLGGCRYHLVRYRCGKVLNRRPFTLCCQRNGNVEAFSSRRHVADIGHNAIGMSNRDSVQNRLFHLFAGLSLVRSSGASGFLSRASQSGFSLCPNGFPRGVLPARRAPLPCAGTRLI
jgi:hypothetical protein